MFVSASIAHKTAVRASFLIQFLEKFHLAGSLLHLNSTQ